jgi:Mrp family chromosome partitioning ATPase/capsular polysaccharide biosynthesis protein
VSVDDGRTPVSLADYLNLLRRRKWVFFATVALVPTVALVVSMRSAAAYEASVKVLLNQQSLGLSTGYADPARTAQTQADLARVREVADQTIEDAHVPGLTPARLLTKSSVQPSPGSDFLTFAVTDSAPDVAERLVSVYAKAFVTFRYERDRKVIDDARAAAEKQRKELEAQGYGGSEAHKNIVDQIAELDAMLVPKLAVLHGAYGPVQVAPRVKRNTGIALILGIILGLLLAFLWDVLDTRIRSAETIRNELKRLPLLGRLPTPPRALRKNDRLVMLAAPMSLDAEPVRVLRANFEFAASAAGARTIMVTSGVGGEGKSTTAANLAVALARSGRRVTLVDLDLRKPDIHSFFGLDGGPGLIDVTLFDAHLEDALVPIPLGEVNGDGTVPYLAQGSLDVLPLGTPLSDPDRLQTEIVGARIVDGLRNRADYVIIDAGPILPAGDTVALSAHVDAIVLVVRLNGLPRNALGDLGRVLETSPAAKLGFVVTGDDATVRKQSQHSGAGRRSAGMNGQRRGGRSSAEPTERRRGTVAAATPDPNDSYAAERS